MRKLLLWLTLLFAPLITHAQQLGERVYPELRLDDVARAIARAEGFYRKGTIPNRYHNPGDLKAVRGFKLPGQKGVGKGRHIIFRTDADGWAALRRQLQLVLDGRSKHYTADMNFNQISRKYAQNWRSWAKQVTHVLGVSGTVTLREYIGRPEPSIELAELCAIY